MTKQNIKVIKVPLNPDEKRALNKLQVFPRMPRLYLELLENKSKIKHNLVNTDYIPSSSSPQPLQKQNITEDNFYNKSDKKKYEEDDIFKDDENNIAKEKDSVDNNNDDFESRLNKYLEENKSVEKKSNNDDKYNDDKYNDDKYNNDKYDDDKHKSDKYDDDKHKSDYDNDYDKHKEDEIVKSPSSDISDRLQELLNEKDDDRMSRSRSDKYSRQRSLSNYRSVEHYQKTNNVQMPPALSELDSRAGITRKKELKDINYTYNEQQEEDLKRELMFKIDLLKKSYPNAIIPEFIIHSDYTTMKKSYDTTVRRLSLDSSVDSYKSYLIGGFMVCEFVLGNYLGFDMQGFTQQQILSMNSYEKLLIELGEKSYMPQGSKWPVEVRLLGLIIMNAVLFIVSKMIMKKTGSNLIGMINNMNSASSSQTQANNLNKKKMKPPNINLDEIPEVSDLNNS